MQNLLNNLKETAKLINNDDDDDEEYDIFETT